MKRHPLLNSLVICLTILMAACSSKTNVDLIVHNANIYTVDSLFSTAEAFAVADGKFIEIGTSEDILNNYQAAETIDAEGKPVYPGFYDSHAHFFGLGSTLDQADLINTQSFEEVVERLRAFHEANPDNKWILGRGWDQNKWPGKEFPDNHLLNEAFPETPIYLTRIDGHAAIVNDKALELSGVTKPREIEGGLFVADNNRLTGVLIDNAMGVVRRNIPDPTEADLTRQLLKAQDSCVSVGLTTIADAGLSINQIDLLKKLYESGDLKIRDYAMVALSERNLQHYQKEGTYASDRLNVRSFKLMADGALGSRGACLLHPYSDASTSGFLLLSPSKLDSVVGVLSETDFQINTHAIGDSANRIMLDVYGKYLKGENDRRWRIEHAQIIAPTDFEKFAAYSIIPSVQPTHATSDMYWAEDRLGAERMKGAYAYKDLLEAYGMLALGSDFPVEHFNPLYGFHAAVARVDANNQPEGGFQLEDAISREEALKGMTIWSAFASFQEDTHGSIENGKVADFVILEQDIMEIPDEQLRNVKVSRTVIGGETVFRLNK
ncbi:amidohydrolase [Albibacterium profundi]|uniref:Amidohydrolase n=1 Tax=Albibacterium profundi TaxID=3134906 RepID=A0ABV5CB87_9SPHI